MSLQTCIKLSEIMEFSSIHTAYKTLGVEGFYKQENYRNPHEAEIRYLLSTWAKEVETGRVLDLGCGDGLVTKILQPLGFLCEGIDPYLGRLYIENTGLECLPLTFKDLAQGKCQKTWPLVVASFSLHLCEESLLPSLIWNLGAPRILVVTPHKKPDLSKFASSVEHKVKVSSKGKSIHLYDWRIKVSNIMETPYASRSL